MEVWNRFAQFMRFLLFRLPRVKPQGDRVLIQVWQAYVMHATDF